MTSQTQPPPNPDWSQLNLQSEHFEYLEYLHEVETRYRLAAVIGQAFLHYAHTGQASDNDLETMELAWYRFIVWDAFHLD